MKRKPQFICKLVALAAVVCTTHASAAVLNSINITPSNPAVAPEQSIQFTATGSFSDGSSRALTNSTSLWQAKASIPQASYGLGGAFVDGKFYAVSGFATTRVGVYNPSNDTWSTAAPLPQLLQYFGIAVLNGKIYVAGGDTGGSGDRATLYRYDPALNTWTNLAPMPLGARYGVRASALNGKLYVVGGYSLASNAPLARVEIYDPANNTWSAGPALPAPRSSPMMGAIGGKLYVAGGTDAGGPLTNGLVLDPSSNVWSPMAAPIVAGVNAVVLGGKLYGLNVGASERQVQVYDPVANSWTTNVPPMLIARHDVGIAADESSQRIFAVGGFGGGTVSALEVFAPVGAPGFWQAAAPISPASYGLGAAYVGGKLYAVSGFATTRVGVYDPANNSWSTAAPLPALLQYFGIAELHGKIYVAGGDTGGSGDRATLYRYDPALNTWTNLAPMPLGARYGVRAAALNGRLYVVGGYSQGSSTYLNRVEIYNPTNNTWTTGTAMPSARFGHLMGVINGRLYAAGGSDGTAPLTNGVVFNPVANNWTAIAAPPTAVSLGAVLGGKLFGLGTSVPQRQVIAYDPVSNTWSTNNPAMPTARWDFGAASDESGGRIFAVGGYNGATVSALEIFTTANGEITWRSSNPSVAAVDGTGFTTGFVPGTSTITAATVSGAISGSTVLTVNVLPPTITNQPMGQVVSAQGTAMFTVGASGVGPFTYQWQLNGTNLVGQTNSSLTLANITTANAGNYSVLVGNSGGTNSSSAALLAVIDLKMYAGITIAGPVGSMYRVDYNENLNTTNWMTLTNVTLATPSVLVIDPDSPQHPNRFYRAVPQP